MDITEVRVKLMDNRRDKLQAFCSVTIGNDFVIRDLKIIEGTNGPFIAMPSRKLADRCPKCSTKNHVRANFCNECGTKLPADRAAFARKGRVRLHVDIAHPINVACREELQNRVLEAYRAELENASRPDYVPAKMNEVSTEDAEQEQEEEEAVQRAEEAVRRADEAEEGAEEAEKGAEEELDAPLETGDYTPKKKATDIKKGDKQDSFGEGIFT